LRLLRDSFKAPNDRSNTYREHCHDCNGRADVAELNHDN